MIVVIADDISGAAEIAAVGKRSGLKAQVQTRFDPTESVNLIAVDTDTRSGTRQQAQERITALADRLRSADIDWCFKKVDSLLRGHVCIEIAALMNSLGKRQTILAPANPSRGRTIMHGQYLINNQPLDQTDFARDTEYPAKSCRITELLSGPVYVAAVQENDLPRDGIVVGQAESRKHLEHWALQVHDEVLPAGGADFFRALLETTPNLRRIANDQTPVMSNETAFFVCGSGSETSRQAVSRAKTSGVLVCPMPDALYNQSVSDNRTLIRQWAEDIVAALTQGDHVIVAIVQPVVSDAQLALHVRTQTAVMVQHVLGKIDIRELLIEGGATGRAILDRMGWQRLNVIGEYGPGIVKMQVLGHQDQIVTLKPGSYPWPEELLGGNKT